MPRAVSPGVREMALARLVEQSPLAIVQVDAGEHIEFVNPAFTELLRQTPESLVGKTLTQAGCTLPPDIFVTLAASKASNWRGEFRGTRGDGSIFHGEALISKLRRDDGRSDGFAVACEDITRRKLIEASEYLHNEQLRHTARLATLGEMASMLAHELNQPLASIAAYSQGCVRRAEKGLLTAESMSSVAQEIASESLRAGEIVRRMLDFVHKRPHSQHLSNILTVVGDAVRLARPLTRHAETDVVLETGEERLPAVKVDKVQIEQVVINLIRNAIDAMRLVPVEKRKIRISVRERKKEQQIEICCQDNGSGLPDGSSDRIFEPFFTTKRDGVGMGLSICRGIVEAHGGAMWASQSDSGSAIFHFTLPAVSKA